MRGFFVLILLVIFCQSLWARPFHIIIDPGHGGPDTGATRGVFKESEIVLNISKQLILLLNDSKDFRVSSTRQTDRLVTLEERTTLSEKQPADIFLSIHANSAPSPSTSGVEIYFQNQLPPDQESLYLANRENEGKSLSASSKPKGDVAAILEDLHRQNQMYLSYNLAREVHTVWKRYQKSRLHLRQAPFHVLSEVKIPSILVETGFITNEKDSLRLGDSNGQKEIAKILYEGVQSYRQRWLKSSR